MSEHDELRTVWWEHDAVALVDQRLLPHQYEIAHCQTVEAVARAIKTMQVRGAPAIGCTAAYGIVLAAHLSTAPDTNTLLQELEQSKRMLDAQRPTAVNLAWATARMLRCAHQYAGADVASLCSALLNEAHTIMHEDLAMCKAIGDHGAPLVPARGQVLTHCNAGGLATAGYGTALGVIRSVHRQQRPLHVFVDETRPFLQGARLTSWELQQEGIAQTLITDSMAGHLMQRGQIDCVIVGADRVVANGDIANKIGTYSLAVLAQAHGIPFYVAAPSSTIDPSLPDGMAIPIEQRASEEVTSLAGQLIAPAGVHAAHPAFDMTPARLISAIITERGVFRAPYRFA
jgi:methylthioribose-1-phosphate isomerase